MHTDLMNQLIQVRDQRWGAYPSCHGTRGWINPGHVATQSGLARRDRQAFTLMFTPTASFHPSIFLSNSGSQGGWSLSQLSLGNKAGYTVDMLPVHHRAKIDRQTTTPIATLKPPVTLLCSLWTSGNQCKLHTKRFPVNSNFWPSYCAKPFTTVLPASLMCKIMKTILNDGKLKIHALSNNIGALNKSLRREEK